MVSFAGSEQLSDRDGVAGSAPEQTERYFDKSAFIRAFRITCGWMLFARCRADREWNLHSVRDVGYDSGSVKQTPLRSSFAHLVRDDGARSEMSPLAVCSAGPMSGACASVIWKP